MRGLSDQFMHDLKQGVLTGVLDRVKADDTLSLEIREGYINIYYRGGNAIKITENGLAYDFWFDTKYVTDPQVLNKLATLTPQVTSTQMAAAWINALPDIKNQMDMWFAKNRKEERDYQQVVVHENNYGGSANDTDYYICDIEYSNRNGRFDMIAVKWPSTGPQRKRNNDLGLAFIEMKYMDKSLTGKAGLQDHIAGMNSFLAIPGNLASLRAEMITVFNQKVDLGLLNKIKKIGSLSDEKPEYILILGNHDPAKSVLRRELDLLVNSQLFTDFSALADLKVATASVMGYGLYNEGIYDIQTFLKKYSHIVK